TTPTPLPLLPTTHRQEAPLAQHRQPARLAPQIMERRSSSTSTPSLTLIRSGSRPACISRRRSGIITPRSSSSNNSNSNNRRLQLQLRPCMRSHSTLA
ncbi:hypothetical protein KEM55_000498, partial [Ascosphaera atra]